MKRLRVEENGFSLIEVLTVVAIISVMGAIAVPNFLSWLANKGIQSASRDLYSNMKKAQSLAVKLNRNCTVTFNGTSGYTVYVDASSPWNAGAITNANFVYNAAAGERVIAQVLWSQYRNVAIDSADPPNFAVNTAGDSSVSFQPNLMPIEPGGGAPNGSVVLGNGNGKKARVSIGLSGNISLKFE